MVDAQRRRIAAGFRREGARRLRGVYGRPKMQQWPREAQPPLIKIGTGVMQPTFAKVRPHIPTAAAPRRRRSSAVQTRKAVTLAGPASC